MTQQFALAMLLAGVTTIQVMGADSGPVVSVAGGQVRGALLEQGGAVFKGIPFAQPPVGELRWQEPMLVKPWTGIRDATAFGPVCAQASNPFVRNAAEVSKEDCLYLNVWTPDWPTRGQKPVMVWIPGGGNFAGGSNGDNGEPLARRGVVLVTLNYRLGSFGFFSHPELTRESRRHASGNQGILDQIAALRWVRDNIAKFGGNPNNVTIFGNSAGALDAGVLMTSPLAKGLFHRVIAQSNPVIILPVNLLGTPLTLREAEKRGEKLAAGWKLPARASLKDMRALSAADINAAEPVYFRNAVENPPPFPNLGIIVDGYVVTRKPAAVFAAGQEHRVPLLLGNSAREQIPGSTPPEDLQKTIEEAYGPLAARARVMYVGPADPVYGTPMDQWRTDSSFRCGSVAQLVWHAAAGNPAFEYEFTRTPPGREALGATHASEVSYVLGNLDRGIGGLGPRVPATPVDRQLSDVMQQYWTNFARNGDPNGGNLPNWPKFDTSRRAFIQFTDAGPIAKEGLRRPFCDLFIENLKRMMAK
jgi:para-nitrobenzyl esterase